MNNLFPDDFEYKQIVVQDSIYSNIRVFLPEAVNFIDYAVQNHSKGGILVHCQKGQS